MIIDEYDQAFDDTQSISFGVEDLGSAEHYAEIFSDYLADIDGNDPKSVENLIEGIYRALDNWFDYHDKYARAYAKLRKRVREALAV